VTSNPDIKLTALQGPAPYVELYELDLTEVINRYDPGSPGLVEYFTPMSTDLVSADLPEYPERTYTYRKLRLSGQEYEPIPVEVSGYDRSSSGALPQPRVRVANATRYFGDYLLKYGDLLGAKLTRTIIADPFMDQPDPANPGLWLPGSPDNYWRKDVYRLEEKTSQTPQWIEWRIVSDMDIEGRSVPGRQMFRDACRLRYRVEAAGGGSFNYDRVTCPYTGLAMFDNRDQPTVNFSEDACSRRITGCVARFPGVAAPIDAFPGLGARD